MKRRILAPFIVLTLTLPLLAQLPAAVDDKSSDDKTEKIASLVEKIQTDATGLGLSENRSFAGARAGALVCKSDKKLAASLLQTSVSELINAQTMAEAEAKGRPNRAVIEMRITQSVRPAVLMTIAGCDAPFALESFYRTRTPAIQRALAASLTGSKPSDMTGIDSSYLRSELALEQQLTLQAAMQNPELASKMLQDSIRKGLTPQSLALLKKLFQKDPEAANSLASEVLDRLSSSTFSSYAPESDNVSLALNILNDYIRPKKTDTKELKFDDLAIRSLAQKLITFSMVPTPFAGSRMPAVIAIAEKLSPASVPALKKAQKAGMPRGARGIFDTDVRRITTGNMTPDQMLTDAKSLSADVRPMVYEAAAAKIAQSGDLTRASDLARANLSGTALDNTMNRINVAYASYLTAQGKYPEAERYIDDLPDSGRFTALLNLANVAFSKDKVENKPFAASLLRKARGILSDRPADNTELGQLSQLVSATAAIEPDDAFGIYEPLVPMLNELADANAVVQGFQNNFSVRSGEFELASGWPFGFRVDPGVIRALAKADFERTQKLIDSFSRREVRIMLRLQLAETGLK